MKVLIVAPSLNVENNISGVSAVTNFIIVNNEGCQYEHFLQGKSDDERGAFNRIKRLLSNYREWKRLLKELMPTLSIIITHWILLLLFVTSFL